MIRLFTQTSMALYADDTKIYALSFYAQIAKEKNPSGLFIHVSKNFLFFLEKLNSITYT